MYTYAIFTLEERTKGQRGREIWEQVACERRTVSPSVYSIGEWDSLTSRDRRLRDNRNDSFGRFGPSIRVLSIERSRINLLLSLNSGPAF